MRGKYKFEHFRDQNFPVYSSAQRGSGILVVPHFHQAAELIRVLEGSVSVYIHAQRFLCRQGDLIFIPPLSVHNVICEEGQAGIRGMTFELSMIREGAYGIPAEKILSKDAVSEYIFPGGSFPALDEAMEQAVEAYCQNTATYKLEMLSALYKITGLLIRGSFKSHQAYENYDRLQPVIDYIGENYQKDITVSELSALLNVCEDHFIRMFKSVTNKTPIRYLMDLRLQEVLKLLLNTELSIADIASRVGFSSANYMTRVFRASLKLTPRQYRNENKKPPQ